MQTESDKKLTEGVRELLKRKKGITEKKMFGGIAFLLNGKMFCGIIKNDLVVRIGPQYYQKTLAKRHARPMDFTGKPMKGLSMSNTMAAKQRKRFRSGSIQDFYVGTG